MTHARAGMLAILCTGFAFAGGEGWTSDYEAAKKEAAASDKSLLIDFTGSDWCGWCIKLQDEVFKHDAFKEGVKDKFVLVELDYPQDTSKLSEATIAQNKTLGEKYAVKGYPTILLTDAQGVPYAATGYQAGGPESYVKSLDELLAKKKTRDEGFASAAKAEGVEKAKFLVSTLDAMELDDVMIANFYSDKVEEIKKSDPEDVTGFNKKIEAKQKMAKFEEELNGYAAKKDHDGALAFIETTLKEGGMEPEDTQKVTMMKGFVYAQQKKLDEAISTLEESKTIAPESEAAGQIEMIVAQLKKAKEKEAPAPAEGE